MKSTHEKGVGRKQMVLVNKQSSQEELGKNGRKQCRRKGKGEKDKRPAFHFELFKSVESKHSMVVKHYHIRAVFSMPFPQCNAMGNQAPGI